jgi:hypothetical protein
VLGNVVQLSCYTTSDKSGQKWKKIFVIIFLSLSKCGLLRHLERKGSKAVIAPKQNAMTAGMMDRASPRKRPAMGDVINKSLPSNPKE